MGLNMIVSKLRCYTQLHNIQQTFFLDLRLMVNSSVPWLAMSLVTFHLKNVAITVRIFFSSTHPITNKPIEIFQLLGNLQAGHLILDMWVNNSI